MEKQTRPITVTTYPSAWSSAEELGNQFKLVVFDAIPHLPVPTWHEIALMYAAPYRLGLTAAYPERGDSHGGVDPVAVLDELVGPVVYSKRIDDLTGEQLAEYRTQRVRVDLTPEERATYDAACATYIGYMREARLRESHGAGTDTTCVAKWAVRGAHSLSAWGKKLRSNDS